jgi:N-methylhydantoinase A
VTDANVVLGYMPAVTVADGQISISAELAEQSVRRVAEPLGLTPLEAASGIHRIANARMTRALRAVSSEKGRDPRDFALIAYGGAGPMHAAGLAEDLGMQTVLVPAVAGLFSAVGLLFARPEFHEVRTCHLDVDAVDPAVVEALFAEMEAKLAHVLEGRSEVEWARTADLRYGGQSWEVEVGFPGGTIDTAVLAALRARFEDEHERLYGVKDQAGSPVEIRALRLVALGEAPTTSSFQLDGASASGSAGSSRRIHMGGKDVNTPVRQRSSFGDAPEPGPLLVDEYDTTVVVPPGWSARRDAATGTLVLERGVGGH